MMIKFKIKSILILVLVCSLGLLYVNMTIKTVKADCGPNNDWPNAPCYDMNSGPSIEEKKKDWEKYYELKGKEWMEMKKDEMYQADKDGILKEWYEYGKESNNMPNYNVWYYYNLYGEAPNVLKYYNGTTTKDILKPIITYYYISPSAIALIISVIGISGFFGYEKFSSMRK